MAGATIIADISRFLLQSVRGAVCPALLASPEQVGLEAPGDTSGQSVLRVYLYGIRDYSDYVAGREIGVHSATVTASPLVFSLDYLVFFSRHSQTAPDPLLTHRILGSVMQLVHRSPRIALADIHPQATPGDPLPLIAFAKLDDHRKQLIWSGLSEPMRPALYLDVGPLQLSGGTVDTPRVRQMEGTVEPR